MCVGLNQSNYLIREVHEEISGTHAGPRSVVTRLMNLGYYWPTMHKDAAKEIHKCEWCQLHALVKISPKHDLVPITSSWPFHKWGMDIVGPYPQEKRRCEVIISSSLFLLQMVGGQAIGKNNRKTSYQLCMGKYNLPIWSPQPDSHTQWQSVCLQTIQRLVLRAKD